MSEPDSPFVPIVDQLNAANDHAKRAQILLQLSDGIIASHGHIIEKACDELAFTQGSDFVRTRLIAAISVRDKSGLLPLATALQRDRSRSVMVRIARGLA